MIEEEEIEFEIEQDSHGKTLVRVTGDTLTEEEKRTAKYAIYAQINGSYKRLLRYLPKGKDE